MGSKLQIPAVVSLLLLFSASTSIAGRAVKGGGKGGGTASFDIGRFGAKGDGRTDDSKALMAAWKKACKAKGGSRVLIPEGTFMMNAVTLEGPCSGSVNLNVRGTIKAPGNAGAINSDSWFAIRYLDKFRLDGGGGFDGQGQQAWKENDCSKNPKCKKTINISLGFLNNSVVEDVKSLNSKHFHVTVLSCNNLTFQRFGIAAPKESINTDGIHIAKSNSVYVIDSHIATGDDCVSVGDGTQNLHVTGVTCGPGHGISIGSLGRYQDEEPVRGVYIKNCTFTGTDNGVRIKTWPNMHGGLVTDMYVEDIIMNNVSNPILIDQAYCPYNQCTKGSSSKVKIGRVSYTNIRGTTNTKLAVNLTCSSAFPCENVELRDIDLKMIGGGSAISQATNVRPKVSGILKPHFTQA